MRATTQFTAGSLRALVVEDDFVLSESLCETLAYLSIHVCGRAAELNSAQAMARWDGFDLAIVDLNLRGEWSYPVLDILSRRHTPFIICTAYSSNEIPPPYDQAPLLTKPFDMQTLQRTISTYFTISSHVQPHMR